jgi:AcrR family transcriptional regulator
VEVAKRHLAERGYEGMSLEAVAAAAGTTTPSLRRRYRSRAELATAAIGSLRFEEFPRGTERARDDALAILQNFQANALRPYAMTTVGTLLAEEVRHPELLGEFRRRLIHPRRAALRETLARGVQAGELPATLDIDGAASMLVGSFYARYLSGDEIGGDWAENNLRMVWPSPVATPISRRGRRPPEARGVSQSKKGRKP